MRIKPEILAEVRRRRERHAALLMRAEERRHQRITGRTIDWELAQRLYWPESTNQQTVKPKPWMTIETETMPVRGIRGF